MAFEALVSGTARLPLSRSPTPLSPCPVRVRVLTNRVAMSLCWCQSQTSPLPRLNRAKVVSMTGSFDLGAT